jgi:hypothetical protein
MGRITHALAPAQRTALEVLARMASKPSFRRTTGVTQLRSSRVPSLSITAIAKTTWRMASSSRPPTIRRKTRLKYNPPWRPATPTSPVGSRTAPTITAHWKCGGQRVPFDKASRVEPPLPTRKTSSYPTFAILRMSWTLDAIRGAHLNWAWTSGWGRAAVLGSRSIRSMGWTSS